MKRIKAAPFVFGIVLGLSFILAVNGFGQALAGSAGQAEEKPAQKDRRPKKLRNIPEKDKRGCYLTSYSSHTRERPSDITGLIAYGFRGLFGGNTQVYIHYNCPPVIEDIVVSATAGPGIFDVEVKFTDPENDVVTYNFEVSGGKLTGIGGKRLWDMTDLKPGKYTIKVCLNDGTGCHSYTSKQLEIME